MKDCSTEIIDPNTGDSQAMWLTKEFEFPNWITNSDFVFGGTCSEWEDAQDNPTPLYDTGQSTIQNDKMKITIDYEVVDLDSGRSPMTYIDEQTGQARAIDSDRYCFLQTYTFENIDPNDQAITGFEFYIFHHSHGADEYYDRVNSTYCNVVPGDPLEYYTPYNSVHNTGNFRYDLTQWNSPPFQGRVSHSDFVSVSSIVEPNWIENSYYEGGHSYSYYKPPRGAHLSIEDRDLNGETSIYSEEVGGAMGWDLGTLSAGQEKSFTLAYMFGQKKEATAMLGLTKTITDPNACYSPGEKFTYRIEWENLSTPPAYDATVIDYLPVGVSYPSGYWSTDPNSGFPMWIEDPNYNEAAHTYTWAIGTIAAEGSGYRELTVTINENAEPGMPLHNEAWLYTSIGDVHADHDVDICCWDTVDPNIIYVDQAATGFNNGTSWDDAYTELYIAMERAKNTVCTQSYDVYVAQGEYSPENINSTFELPDNISVYGGFKSGGCDFSERNPKSRKTILTGQIDGIGPADVDTVVTMGDDTLLDGFTVTKSKENAIYGNGVDFTVENCVIGDNEQYGIRATNGDVTVKWCNISKCGFHGILHEGDGDTLTVENSQIIRNRQHGIFCLYSTPTVKNSIICESGLGGSGHAGIFMFNPTAEPKLYNNTLANNRAEGIAFVDNADASGDPNDKDWPDVQNCIVYYNNDGGKQVAGFSVDTYANFCSIQDCNELDTTTNYNDEPGFAYTVDPNGTPDPENYHLAYDSFCIDKANPSQSFDYSGQVDMDGEGIDRKYGDYVDIGADEVYGCEEDDDLSEANISNPLDWNADGQVNLVEFSKFSAAWLSHDPNDSNMSTDPEDVNEPNYIDPAALVNWDPICNLDESGDSEYEIDFADLEVFLSDTPWLWIACWKLEEINAASQASAQTESMMGLPFEMSSMSASTAPEPEPEVSVDRLVQLVGFLDEVAADNPDNIEAIQKVREDLMDQIKAIINEENQ